MPATKQTRSILKMSSPTGVADFIQIDPAVMKNNLNSSFSWVECPIDKVVPSSTPFAERMAQIQKRLDWLDQQRAKDQQEYQRQLAKAKEQARKDFEKRHANYFGTAKNYDVQVSETSKIINYLKQDNARLREDLKRWKRDITKLKQANQELEIALSSAQNSYVELEDHVQTLQAVNFKLTDNVHVFGQTLKRMKSDYQNRTRFYRMETKTVAMYEMCLAKVLAQVQHYAKNNLSSKQTLLALERELYDMTAQSANEVGKGRTAYLAKAGLTMDATQRLQTDRLLNPDLLVIMYQKKNKSGDDSSDSDSDSDSDDDEDDSDYEKESVDDED